MEKKSGQIEALVLGSREGRWEAVEQVLLEALPTWNEETYLGVMDAVVARLSELSAEAALSLVIRLEKRRVVLSESLEGGETFQQIIGQPWAHGLEPEVFFAGLDDLIAFYLEQPFLGNPEDRFQLYVERAGLQTTAAGLARQLEEVSKLLGVMGQGEAAAQSTFAATQLLRQSDELEHLSQSLKIQGFQILVSRAALALEEGNELLYQSLEGFLFLDQTTFFEDHWGAKAAPFMKHYYRVTLSDPEGWLLALGEALESHEPSWRALKDEHAPETTGDERAILRTMLHPTPLLRVSFEEQSFGAFVEWRGGIRILGKMAHFHESDQNAALFAMATAGLAEGFDPSDYADPQESLDAWLAYMADQAERMV